MSSPADHPERSSPETECPARIHIQLLGDFEIRCGHRGIPSNAWRSNRAASLLKILALSPDHARHRDQLLELLWPDLSPAAAANNLRYTLYMARQVIASTFGTGVLAVERQRDRLRLSGSFPIVIDVQDFERAAGLARAGRTSDAYDRAVALYTGHLLPEDRYSDWTAGRRESLRATYLTLLLESADLHAAEGNRARAIDLLERAVDIDPLAEPAHAELMRLYALAGRRRDALQQYRSLETALREELDAAPEPPTREFHADILERRFPPKPADPISREPMPGSAPHSATLPVYLTSFVGRHRELASLPGLVAGHRLVTLTGSGGVGKTRLAAVLATEIEDCFPDGVRAVDLSSLSDSHLVWPVVMPLLDVRDDTGHLDDETLARSLGSKRMLLILDNCEHLIEAVVALVETLLRAGPNFHVLATSREVLRLPGEVVWEVKPLGLPDPGLDQTIDVLRESGAVGLFLDRLRLRQPDLILTPEIAPHVVEICRRLDGLPLAIEMAAARAATMSLPDLARRLRNAVAMLASPGYSGPARHETLQAMLDWSHDLLTDNEQAVFARFSVFAGDWTLDAAESVVATGTITQDEVIGIVSELVDKSLIVREGDLLSSRYRFLAPVRQYARVQLDERGETRSMVLRHAEYYLALAEQAEPKLTGPDQREWLDRLEDEHSNFRAALQRSLDVNDVETATRLAGALAQFWWAHSHYAEGRSWLTAVLDRSGTAQARARAKALAGLANITQYQGDWEMTREICERQIEIWRSLDEPRGVARSLGTLAVATGELGNVDRSVELLEESLALSREIGDLDQMARMLNSLGEVARLQGNAERSIELYRQSLNLYQETGDQQRVTTVRHNLAYARQMQGQHQAAAQVFRTCLESYQQLGSEDGIAQCLTGLAGVEAVAGDPHRAARLFGAAEALRASIGAIEDAADRAQTELHVAIAREALGESEFSGHWAAGGEVPVDEAISLALSTAEALDRG